MNPPRCLRPVGPLVEMGSGRRPDQSHFNFLRPLKVGFGGRARYSTLSPQQVMRCVFCRSVCRCPSLRGPTIDLKRKSAQRGSFRPDVPADIRPKHLVRPFQCWEKKTSILAWTCLADVHKKLRSEKLRADFGWSRMFGRRTSGTSRPSFGSSGSCRLLLHFLGEIAAQKRLSKNIC